MTNTLFDGLELVSKVVDEINSSSYAYNEDQITNPIGAEYSDAAKSQYESLKSTLVTKIIDICDPIENVGDSYVITQLIKYSRDGIKVNSIKRLEVDKNTESSAKVRGNIAGKLTFFTKLSSTISSINSQAAAKSF